MPLVQTLNSDREWRWGESSSSGEHDAGSAERVRCTLRNISENPDVEKSSIFFWRKPLLFSFISVLNDVYNVLRTMLYWPLNLTFRTLWMLAFGSHFHVVRAMTYDLWVILYEMFFTYSVGLDVLMVLRCGL